MNRYLSDARLAALAASAEAKRVEAARVWAAFTARRNTMSAFSGSQSRGAMREHRARKHAEASERNARTPAERTRQYRRDEATHVLVAVFGGDGATGGASDG